jgi:hypothetical protein
MMLEEGGGAKGGGGGGASDSMKAELEALKAENAELKKKAGKSEYRIQHLISSLEEEEKKNRK